MAWAGARAAASFSGTRVPNALRPAKNSLLLIFLIKSNWRHYIDKAPINVRELRYEFDRQRRVPRPLVVEQARVAALSTQAWAECRARSDFKSFEPWLERTLPRVGGVRFAYNLLLRCRKPAA